MPGHVAVVVALIKHKAPWDSFRYKRGNFVVCFDDMRATSSGASIRAGPLYRASLPRYRVHAHLGSLLGRQNHHRFCAMRNRVVAQRALQRLLGLLDARR